MKCFNRWLRMALASAAFAAGLILAPPAAYAQLTPAGTDITNTSTLNYSVSGVAQPAVNSNTTTFKVDNLVRVVVAEGNAAHTAVAPGATVQVLTFTVTNTGNQSQDYALTAANLAVGATVTLGGTPYSDDFEATGCVTRIESGATLGYQAAEDTNVAIGSLAASASRTVYVVCNIPTVAIDPAVINGNDAIVSLAAVTSNPGSCNAATGAGCVTTTQTAGADTPGAVDVVFGDVAGTDDAARDGTHSARDVYRVVAAVLGITKTVTPICDPFNFNVTPKNIPGAYVRYEITISNAPGAGSATLTTVQDTLNANLNFDPDLRTGGAAACATSAPENAAGNGFRLTCTGGTRACATTPVFFTTTAADDAIGLSGATLTAAFGDGPGTDALPTEAGYLPGELKGGESITIRYNAVVK